MHSKSASELDITQDEYTCVAFIPPPSNLYSSHYTHYGTADYENKVLDERAEVGLSEMICAFAYLSATDI